MMDRLRRPWDRLPGTDTVSGGDAGGARMLAFAAPADVFESDDALLVMVDCPGLDPERIEVNATGAELTIAGERPAPSHDAVQILARERPYGRFARAVPLPFPIERDGIEAQYRHGVLLVKVPKAASARRRRIDVK